MKKILLVFEEYNDVVPLEVLLKKVGFDTIGMTKEVAIGERMLSFDPDVMIALGRGQRVNGLELSKKYRDHKKTRFILVFNPDARPAPKELIGCRIDSIMTTPIDPIKLLTLCATLSGDQAAKYVEKFRKLSQSDEELQKVAEAHFISWDMSSIESPSETGDEAQRVAKYKRHISQLELPEQKAIHVKDAQEAQKKLMESWDMERLDRVNADKREFARALFDEDSDE